ncbi:hypothetical protein BPTFM16_01007 [Altererythrobacter insulae]|nr:hypothetical protein BPTFM16_01007 [Altererythrobacter insulae]
MLSTLMALALVAQGEPAQPTEKADETAEKAVEEKVEEKSEDKRICRSIRLDTSSRKKERICLTREGWREFNRGN